MSDKEVNASLIGWAIVLLPYEIGLLFMLFGAVTFGQVLFWGTAFYALIFVIGAFLRAPLAAMLGIVIGSKL
ncbi:hypothetical protein [Aggregatibacter actinomycetemcomitans]|uniref:hypothetical protein n=1 Tax=Aggregatibacter actinomycetemcomitans TaxID=714 RepID=UPI00022BFE3C|nr:hypothetical protein [Aggregatibacter actinomycetemcomitans]KOE31384.1 hypothetical protein D17P3_0304930 [Aggregatibacter actinomycetemcomitans D17P-3]KOE62609.1 hypothetical protein D17P2_0302955 [Aggregatibacter actinomycetemcomitans serotype c str. D17P-2]